MKIPKLQPSGRDREYKLRTFNEISQIIRTWLFRDDIGHREMDEEILELDSEYSLGLQSMNVLHYLGLKKDFKGLFVNTDLNTAIQELQNNEQDFELIIELLENTKGDSSTTLFDSLYETAKSRDSNFEENYAHRLQELQETDGKGNQAQSRKEQGLLRSILFKNLNEVQCAICHKTLPTNLLVAAHIKPRSKCTTSERKNPNIVMPVCKVGCDDFFEKGYVIVDEDGFVRVNKRTHYPSDLQIILRSLEGNACTHFNPETAEFFSFKRSIINL
jgi:hypothetical protein